jgi:hypothetical protein
MEFLILIGLIYCGAWFWHEHEKSKKPVDESHTGLEIGAGLTYRMPKREFRPRIVK